MEPREDQTNPVEPEPEEVDAPDEDALADYLAGVAADLGFDDPDEEDDAAEKAAESGEDGL